MKAGGKERREEIMEQQEMLLGSRNTHHNPLFNSCPVLSPSSSKDMRMAAKELGIFLSPTNVLDNNQKENQVDVHKSLQSFEIKSAAAKISPIRGILQERQSMQDGNRSSPEQGGLKNMMVREVSLSPSRATEVVASNSQSSPNLLSIMELQRRIKDILEEEAGGVESEMDDGELESLSWGCETSDTGTTDLTDELKKETLPYHPKLNLLSPRPQFLRYRPNRRLEFLCEDNAEVGSVERIHDRPEVFKEEIFDGGCPVRFDFLESNGNRSNTDWISVSDLNIDQPVAVTNIEAKAAEIQEKEDYFHGEGEIERGGNSSIAADIEENSRQIESVDHVKEEQARIDETVGRESNLEGEKGVHKKGKKFTTVSASTRWILCGLCLLMLGYTLKSLLLRSLSFGILPTTPKQEHIVPLGLLNEQTLRSHRLSKPLLRRELSILLKGWVAGELEFPAQTLVNASELLRMILTIHAEHVSRNQASTFLPFSAEEMDRIDQNFETFVSAHEKNPNVQLKVQDFDGLSTSKNMEKNVVGLVEMDRELGSESHLSFVSNHVGHLEELNSTATDEMDRNALKKIQLRVTKPEDRHFVSEFSEEILTDTCQRDCQAPSHHGPEYASDIKLLSQQEEKNLDTSEKFYEGKGKDLKLVSHKDPINRLVVSAFQEESGSDIPLALAFKENLQEVQTYGNPPSLLNAEASSVHEMHMKSFENKEHHGYYGSRPLVLIFFFTLLSLLALFLLLATILRNSSALGQLRLASGKNMPNRDVELHTSPLKQAVHKESSATKRVSSTLKKHVSSTENHLIVSPKRNQVSPFGSFTDYKVVFVNEGLKREHLTPVRRSSRIRNKIQSPSDQIRRIKSPR